MNSVQNLLEKYSIDRTTLAISFLSAIFTAGFILIDENFAKYSIDLTYQLITRIFDPLSDSNYILFFFL